MTTFAVTNAEIIVAGLDMSSYLNKGMLKVSAAQLDVTTFGQTYRNFLGGLRDTELTWDGFWTSVPDAAQFAALGVTNTATTVCPEGAEQKVAYLFQAGQFSYSEFSKIGDAAPFSAALKGTDGVTGAVPGQLGALNRVVSATGQVGSILTMTAVGATQFLYATLHVLVAATTITIQVQSAPTVGFGAPTTRATIGPLTVTGGTFMTRVAGPITDAFWRFNCSAQTGSFTISGAIGIK
jgi:hypothetical protein